MGDFNEVRRKTERFGSVFNVQGADMFNTFIANAGLEEIPLGGSSFTWCHKSATKMSKLDRYFNHWTELDGFNKFVIDTWNSAPVETNAMRNVMQKFKFLKGKIREWLKIFSNTKQELRSGILKEELNRIDAGIMIRPSSDIINNRRMESLIDEMVLLEDIINEVRKLKDQGINMRDFMYIKVGNGETTKFWDDIWIGSKPLKLLFPRIYALDNIKDASICMKLNEPSLDNNFRRSIRGGIEQSQFKKLTDLLIPIVLNPCPDRWFWSLEGSGEFSVASIRRFIDDQRLLTVDSKTLWIKSVPIKVNILAWKIKLEALPTRFNISRRDKLRAKFVLGGISNIRTLTPSLNGSTGWPLYVFSLKLR
ncbi:hypothetical protein Tco_1201998 [Tanacetum coccineum]